VYSGDASVLVPVSGKDVAIDYGGQSVVYANGDAVVLYTSPREE
jgi:hypothetical protein